MTARAGKGGTKVHLVVEGGGILLAVAITAGQAYESKHVASILEAVHLLNGKARPTRPPKKLAGDKAAATQPCAPTCVGAEFCP